MIGHVYLGRGFTSFEAELAGVEAVVHGLLLLLCDDCCFDSPVVEWYNRYLLT